MKANEALAKFATTAWPKIMLIAVLAAALFFFLGIDKGVSEQEFANAENQRKQAEALLKKTKEAVTDLKKFRSQIDDLNNQFLQMTTYMNANPRFSDLFSDLRLLATQSGTIVRSVTPSNKVERIDFYETSRVSLQLEGRYQQIMGFLSDLSKMRRLVTIDELGLDQAQGGDVKTGHIVFKATIVGYRYAPPAAAGTPNPNDPALPGAPNAR